MATVRRKCFISYHHADEDEVHTFINTYDHLHNVFIYRGLGLGMEEDLINSNDTDYVMGEIRRRYLKDSTVTIVMVGRCTWARRYVDWEIQSSLRRGQTVTPNGLLGITLPSTAGSATLPERLAKNVIRNNGEDVGYALWYKYPSSTDSLSNIIEQAYARRSTHQSVIVNPRERFRYNKSCG